jgi:hypothetical protein
MVMAPIALQSRILWPIARGVQAATSSFPLRGRLRLPAFRQPSLQTSEHIVTLPPALSFQHVPRCLSKKLQRGVRPSLSPCTIFPSHQLDVDADSSYDAAHLYLTHVRVNPACGLPIPTTAAVFEVVTDGRIHRVSRARLKMWIERRREEWKGPRGLLFKQRPMIGD